MRENLMDLQNFEMWYLSGLENQPFGLKEHDEPQSDHEHATN